MKLTSAEKQICKKYGATDKSGYCHCDDCPLALSEYELLCYATIDGRTKRARALTRYASVKNGRLIAEHRGGGQK